ncbi:11798_t:CDS:1, partial [Racocetra fulgida]
MQNLEASSNQTLGANQVIATSAQSESFDPNNPDAYIDKLLGLGDRITKLE